MRSVLLVLLTVALLGGGLALYTFMQPANPAGPQRPLTATSRPQIRPGETFRLIGEGENVWLKRYDPKTGELESQFKGAKYVPQQDGTVTRVFIAHKTGEWQANNWKSDAQVLVVRGKGDALQVLAALSTLIGL